MDNYNNDVFEFGIEPNEELEQTSDFDYASISGLGESDYQNEDLFNNEVYNNKLLSDNDYRIGSLDSVGDTFNNNLSLQFEDQQPEYLEETPITSEDIFGVSPESINEVFVNNVQNSENDVFNIPLESVNITSVQEEESQKLMGDAFSIPIEPINEILQEDNDKAEEMMGDTFSIPIEQEKGKFIENLENNQEIIVSETPMEESNELTHYEEENIEETDINSEVYEFNPEPIIPGIVSYNKDEFNSSESSSGSFEEQEKFIEDLENNQEIIVSETPMEELNELTHYEEENIEETDINSLFDRVSVNVKEASDIFRKNTDLKKKIDNRFEELKKLQSEIENSRKKQIDEINSYKEEVLNKLTEKKEEIEKRLNLLKESQAALEKEKQEFEQYRKEEKENIEKVQKEVQAAYDDRREELGHIEDVLRKQKDSLDEERSQLSLDRIEYEADKNELANNLLKFDELVNSFTNGISEVKE